MENSDTFDSLLTVLRGRGDHRVGLVGWGAGTGFEASVLSIAHIDRAITEIRYFGDLDETGCVYRRTRLRSRRARDYLRFVRRLDSTR
jgi:hypothetical protein